MTCADDLYVRVLHLPQVYGASNVELITRTRTEHLSEQHKGKVKGNEAEAHGGGGRTAPT